MREILDITAKIPPILSVTLDFTRAHPDLQVTQDIIYCLQMGFYWWKECAQEMANLMEGTADAALPGTAIEYAGPPNLEGCTGRDYLNYMYTSLKDLTKEAQGLSEDLLLPPKVLLWFQSGIFNIMQARFSAQITIDYYEQQIKYRQLRGAN